MNRNIVTLEQFIIENQRNFNEARGEFSQVLRDLVLAARIVNHEVNRAGLVDILGEVGNTNVQGEAVKKLDVFANHQFIRALRLGTSVCVIGSEENEDIISIPAANGRYAVLLDPLDGSSNIDVNVPVGSVFSIYRRITPTGKGGSLEDCLQRGRDQVAAGYILYGTSTVLVFTTGQGVNGFTLDPSLGEFFLSHPNLTFPPQSQYYSMNEGLSTQLLPYLQQYLAEIKERNATGQHVLSARYVGSLVADFHRNLLKGGIFLYPGTVAKPEGKLRLLYEANPMAWLAEQAGGMATDGRQRILDIRPTRLHQRTPLIIGGKDEVGRVMSYIHAQEIATLPAA